MCKTPIYDSQGCAHIFKDTLEPTDRVNGNNRNHSKQNNNILHEMFCEMFQHRSRQFLLFHQYHFRQYFYTYRRVPVREDSYLY